jgi:hypothetical protein
MHTVVVVLVGRAVPSAAGAVLPCWRLELSGREGVEMEINQPEIGENERERVNPKRLE